MAIGNPVHFSIDCYLFTEFESNKQSARYALFIRSHLNFQLPQRERCRRQQRPMKKTRRKRERKSSDNDDATDVWNVVCPFYSAPYNRFKRIYFIEKARLRSAKLLAIRKAKKNSSSSTQHTNSHKEEKNWDKSWTQLRDFFRIFHGEVFLSSAGFEFVHVVFLHEFCVLWGAKLKAPASFFLSSAYFSIKLHAMRVGCFRQVEKIVRLENSKQRGTYYNILPLNREEKPLNILNTVDRFGRRYRSEQAEPKRSVSQFRLRYRKNFMLAIFLSVCDKPFIFVLARMANLSEREPNEKKTATRTNKTCTVRMSIEMNGTKQGAQTSIRMWML